MLASLTMSVNFMGSPQQHNEVVVPGLWHSYWKTGAGCVYEFVVCICRFALLFFGILPISVETGVGVTSSKATEIPYSQCSLYYTTGTRKSHVYFSQKRSSILFFVLVIFFKAGRISIGKDLEQVLLKHLLKIDFLISTVAFSSIGKVEIRLSTGYFFQQTCEQPVKNVSPRPRLCLKFGKIGKIYGILRRLRICSSKTMKFAEI